MVQAKTPKQDMHFEFATTETVKEETTAASTMPITKTTEGDYANVA